MLAPDHPLERLAALSNRRATGELVAASEAAETHVYLHAGRIVWATDSRRPQGFARQLLLTAGIPADTLREVTEECRRCGLPLGETLISWGLVSAADLRLALERQLSETLALLRADDPLPTLFLARDWPSYDTGPTFTLADLLPSSAEGTLTDDEPAAAVRVRVDGLVWVERFDGDRRVDVDPAADAPRTSAALLNATLVDDARFVAVRHADGCTLGLQTGGRSSLWCQLADESRLGGVLAALAIGGGATDRRPPSTEARAPDPVWTIGDADDPGLACILGFVRRAQEVVAVVLVDEDQAVSPRAGVGFIPAERCVGVARRRRGALVDAGGALEGTAMVSDEGDLWCFGARLWADGRSTGRTVWIFLDRGNAQGLGWTYVTALARSLLSTFPE